MFALHRNNNCQVWSCKRKVPQKKEMAEKNTGGGQICPPPGQLGLIYLFWHHWRSNRNWLVQNCSITVLGQTKTKILKIFFFKRSVEVILIEICLVVNFRWCVKVLTINWWIFYLDIFVSFPVFNRPGVAWAVL